MSWFGGNSINTQELDDKIVEATSESIPNGEYDVAVAFEITDIIKSKKIPAKQCMRSLKKRLTNTYQNPNLLTSTLRLIDVCVKNGGYHFLVEISSKEFIDYLVDYIFKVRYNIQDSKVMYNEAKLNVGNLILGYIKNWTIFFKNQVQLNYVESVYNDLLRKGYQFPETDTSEYLNGAFIDTETPADWIDNDECMICYKPFSMMNRKHHCRSCGGVFCQEHSSRTMPLPSLGIMEPVRVCDNCHFKSKYKLESNKNLALKNNGNDGHHSSETSNNVGDGEDEDLKRAIELSLKESGGFKSEAPQQPKPQEPEPVSNGNADDEDEEMKAAIAASLKEFQAQEQAYKRQQQAPPQTPGTTIEEPQSEFYNNILPFDKYSQPQQQPETTAMDGTSSQGFIHSASNPERLTPSMHIQKHLKPDDLTQTEEESINLYVTLVNQLKTDANRQANILYDKDLNDLHAKVIQIKPKLNKALRNAIERYEKFVELNNKISTITKLYDEFLEAELSQAYGKHHLYTNQNNYPADASGYNLGAVSPVQNRYSQMPSQFTGQMMGQTTGPMMQTAQQTGQIPNNYNNPIPHQPQSPQFTNSSNYQESTVQATAPQFTGSVPYNAEIRRLLGGPQYSRPPESLAGNQMNPNYTGQQFAQYDSQGSNSQYVAPSEPVFEENEHGYSNDAVQYSQEDNKYSNISSYPPVENISNDYNAPSYPPQEYPSNPPVQAINNTGSSMESTKSRYPAIEEMEINYPPPSSSQPAETLSMPLAPQTSFDKPASKRVEEPLIEL